MSTLSCTLLQSCLWLTLVATALAAKISPIVIPPSGYWDGDDGQWSSFFVQVGTPGQLLRLLPGTSVEASTIFWVVRSEGCEAVNPTLSNCANARGGIFQHNTSTTWSTQGLANGEDGAIYTLVTVEESKIGLSGNGSYGYDTVSLGVGKSGLPTLNNTLIAEIWTDDFFLGVLPLSPLPFNFTNGFNTPIPSMLGQLRNTSQVPSLSWAYTAGAYYRDSSTNKFGSLTLGGYDASRFVANNVSFSFGSDFTRDLLLKLTSITYNTVSSTPLLTTSVNVYIDSLVTELWLPTSVCDAFAKAFNLTYNSGANRYLLDDKTHNALLASNPTFSFALSNGTQSVTIALPYASFDLNLTAPIVGNTTHTFPIRRGQNESQYVLGRTFLQEAYIIADYEKQKFSVNQAVFPSTSVSQNIVSIDYSTDGQTSSSKSGLSGGAIAGIVIGAVAAILLLVALFFLLRRRRRARRAREIEPQEIASKSMTELDGDKSAIREMDGTTQHKAKVAPGLGAHELGHDPRYELENDNRFEMAHEQRYEMAGQHKYELGSGAPVHELPEGREAAVELPAP
ncbi:hypothetical protein AMS68_005972 [Peltaster fructicola]|uniref:Peptidase A1 domain-containing protein n=1 Tax=Peltaster fructicola TaxID=286661 RepID=A0A6H0Y0M0_9PEZI|nr:hypothetical protein AMS68_005972 [Peltaster fructicola]